MHVRNTKSKSLILETLKNSKQAVSHEKIQAELGESVDRATIYRVLNRFCEEGIAHRITGDDGKQYFAACLKCQGKEHRHNHLHFRCLNCGKVECLPNEIELKLPAGYRPANFNGFISGHCPACA
ncbi:ferric uptake regulation protein [Adhaeribacter aerolatus]|uniref:Ferric uptake regulation protein n=1 Tax=Adhaeribacter aerolatus TaxID=670289 RepID=A0A512B116_9BACT|nr:transcriptional repressor [Adhaeribacter aerolatus]GEO05642.1 ferric uptake regulation protein [Adhaeribacter aerolatus]